MSFTLNQVSISGNLTRDPETKQAGQTTITSFSIAHNQRRKVGEDWQDVAHFLDCQMFGAQGEWLAKNATRGQAIVVAGTLEQQRWQDKTTGENRSKVSIVARDVVLGAPAGGRQQASEPQQSGYQSAASPYGSSPSNDTIAF